MTAFASILVLLSATTLGNSRETTVWVHFLESARVGEASPLIVDSLALIAIAGLFLVPYALAMPATARSRGSGDVRATMYEFACSLMAIGVAYLIAHNAPLLMTGMPRFIQDLSDPFDRGWNLSGDSECFRGLPDVAPARLVVRDSAYRRPRVGRGCGPSHRPSHGGIPRSSGAQSDRVDGAGELLHGQHPVLLGQPLVA